MKRIFTLILFAAVLSANAATAQNRNDRNNDQDRYQVNQRYDNWDQNSNDRYAFEQRKDNGKHKGWNKSKGHGYHKDKGRDDDYRRQQEYDRMNQDCDSRVEVYRNDRSINPYERDRRIQQVEYERQQKAKAFGTGVVVGGIAAILIGVLISGGH